MDHRPHEEERQGLDVHQLGQGGGQHLGPEQVPGLVAHVVHEGCVRGGVGARSDPAGGIRHRTPAKGITSATRFCIHPPMAFLGETPLASCTATISSCGSSAGGTGCLPPSGGGRGLTIRSRYDRTSGGGMSQRQPADWIRSCLAIPGRTTARNLGSWVLYEGKGHHPGLHDCR